MYDVRKRSSVTCLVDLIFFEGVIGYIYKVIALILNIFVNVENDRRPFTVLLEIYIYDKMWITIKKYSLKKKGIYTLRKSKSSLHSIFIFYNFSRETEDFQFFVSYIVKFGVSMKIAVNYRCIPILQLFYICGRENFKP